MATITDILNSMNESGVFSYVIPFLFIFVVVFAILEKSGILRSGSAGAEKDSRPISAVVAACIGLLALQFDQVSIFFATIFPRFGVGLSVLLVILIILGLVGFNTSFMNEKGDGWRNISPIGWIGMVVAGAVVIWTIANYTTWFDGIGGYGLSSWTGEYGWSIFWIAVIVVIIGLMVKGGKGGSSGKSGGSKPEDK